MTVLAVIHFNAKVKGFLFPCYLKITADGIK